MRLFFSALMVILMLSFNELEASDLRKLIPRTTSSERYQDRRNIVDTPRPVTPWGPTIHPTSWQNQAPFLYGHRPDIIVSSQHLSSTGMIRNEQMQNQKQQYNQEHLRQGSVDFYHHFYGVRAQPVSQPGDNAINVNEFRQHPIDRNSKKPTNMKSGRSREEPIRKEPPKKLRELRIREPISSQHTVEASTKNLHATKEIGHPKHFQHHQPFTIYQDQKDYESYLLYQKYYPDGLPSPKRQPYTSSEKPPPALHEIDDTVTKGGYRRRPILISEKAPKRKDVSDSHDQLSQQSQLPENAFQDYQPELINNDVSRYNNPYLEYQRHDSKGYPNPHYHWHHSGGSGSGS